MLRKQSVSNTFPLFLSLFEVRTTNFKLKNVFDCFYWFFCLLSLQLNQATYVRNSNFGNVHNCSKYITDWKFLALSSVNGAERLISWLFIVLVFPKLRNIYKWELSLVSHPNLIHFRPVFPPLKALENQRYSDVFRRYMKRILT